MAEKKDPNAMKITNQFRSRIGFVYDLRCEGMRLTINISQRQSPADPGEWNVEARTSADGSPVVAWASTRKDALREVGRLWLSKELELGLPRFDWEAVASALTDVRAL